MLFDPASITTWISLSAAALLLLFGVFRAFLRSKLAEKIMRKDAFPLIKGVINKVFWIVLAILLISAMISVLNIFYNNKTSKVIDSLRKSQELLQNWAFLDGKEKDRAVDQLKTAATFYNSYEVLVLLGTVLLDNNDFNEAYAVLHKAIEKKREMLSLLNTAIACDRLEYIDESLSLYDQIIAMKPSNLSEQVYLAKAYHNKATDLMGLYQKDRTQKNLLLDAQRLLSEAQKRVSPENGIYPDILASEALLYEHMGTYDKSAGLYKKAIDLKEAVVYSDEKTIQLGILYNNASSLLLKTLEYASALEYADDSLDVFTTADQKDYMAYSAFNVAEAYRGMKRNKDARSYYLQAKKLFAKAGIDSYDQLIDKRLGLISAN